MLTSNNNNLLLYNYNYYNYDDSSKKEVSEVDPTLCVLWNHNVLERILTAIQSDSIPHLPVIPPNFLNVNSVE